MRMVLAVTLAIAPLLAKGNEPVKRLNDSVAVFSEIMANAGQGHPARPAGERSLGRTATAQTDAQTITSELYGKKLKNREIVSTPVRTPNTAAKLISPLNKYSARERTSKSTGSRQIPGEK